MTSSNRYDVTNWTVGDPYEDIGIVLNSIINDIKERQFDSTLYGGKPGGVIYIPPGDYLLRTQVVIDISFLRIEGSGHGFTSSSIRFNVPESEWPNLHELWPGGSRILVDIDASEGQDEWESAGFYVHRTGNPRISSIEFSNFCIDGLHFVADDSKLFPENTYVNGKTGIYVADANDSFRINGMGFIYLESALKIYNADALSIHDNFIAECGSCIELCGWGQASKITDNLIGAGLSGHSIYAENHGGLLITANNIFPRGVSSVYLSGVTRSNISNNRLHSFYPGMMVLTKDSSENLISSNHFLRDQEPWAPFDGVNNGLDDDFGLLRIDGSHNSIIGNHFSEVMDHGSIRPKGTKPAIIRVSQGEANYIASNHSIGVDVTRASSESAYESQVDALLNINASKYLPIRCVVVEANSTRNTILDSGKEDEVEINLQFNAFRPTPSSSREPA